MRGYKEDHWPNYSRSQAAAEFIAVELRKQPLTVNQVRTGMKKPSKKIDAKTILADIEAGMSDSALRLSASAFEILLRKVHEFCTSAPRILSKILGQAAGWQAVNGET